ncbi:MAG: alpha/beta hydrolase [Chromatiales bacterium]|jgi:arylformamidase|nr:alpha/beta hydrolase [Chromatiales bacterium]
MTEIDAAVDAQYNLRGHPDREPVYARYTARSEAFRAEMTGRSACQLDVAYGNHPRARLDVFHADDPKGVLVFFHGGYWRALDKNIFSLLAESFIANNLTVVMPAYPLAPESSLPVIVDHARMALDWIAQDGRLERLPLVVSGHSAGGHLAAMCALSHEVAGAIPISGLFDLEPLRHTNVNIEARMSAEVAAALSPALTLRPTPVPTLLIVGGDETQGFEWQTANYAAILRGAGGAASVIQPQGCNHFTILDPFSAPNEAAHKSALAFAFQCIGH